MVLEQAEKEGLFNREDAVSKRFAYSHLWVGLGYSGIQSFLGLSTNKGFKQNPVPRAKLTNLVDLCLWLYGSKQKNKAPVIRSQNPDLRNLDEVLRSPDGVAALRGGLPLETSLRASRGDERLLREAMVMAEQKLKEALGLVVTGYKGASDLYEKSKDICSLANKIAADIDAGYQTTPHLTKSRSIKK
jgi:hypothetical protein